MKPVLHPSRRWALMALVAALSLAATAATFPLAESPWPMYRKDPAHTGRSTVRGPGAATVRWVFSTGAQDKAGGIETDPAIGPDGTVYVGANNGIFYALDGKTGEIRWVRPTLFEEDAIYSSALVARDGLVIFGGKDGIVLALTAPREGILGHLLWSARIPATVETSPALASDGTLYVGGGDWSMYAIAPPADGGTAGRILWGFPTGGSLVSSPAVASDATLYFGSMDGKLYALEPAPGGRPRVKWTFTTGRTGEHGGIENAPAGAPDGTLYVGANNGLFYALDPGSGRVNWSFKTGYTTYAIFSAAAVWHDGAAIFGAKDGNLYVLHGENGKLAWGCEVGKSIETSPAMGADGTIYFGADDGKMYAVAPPPRGDRGILRWTFQTGGQLISSPALGADGTLYEGSLDKGLRHRQPRPPRQTRAPDRNLVRDIRGRPHAGPPGPRPGPARRADPGGLARLPRGGPRRPLRGHPGSGRDIHPPPGGRPLPRNLPGEGPGLGEGASRDLPGGGLPGDRLRQVRRPPRRLTLPGKG